MALKELNDLQKAFLQLGDSYVRQLIRERAETIYSTEYLSKPVYLETVISAADYHRRQIDLLDELREATKNWVTLRDCKTIYLKYPTVIGFVIRGTTQD